MKETIIKVLETSDPTLIFEAALSGEGVGENYHSVDLNVLHDTGGEKLACTFDIFYKPGNIDEETFLSDIDSFYILNNYALPAGEVLPSITGILVNSGDALYVRRDFGNPLTVTAVVEKHLRDTTSVGGNVVDGGLFYINRLKPRNEEIIDIPGKSGSGMMTIVISNPTTKNMAMRLTYNNNGTDLVLLDTTVPRRETIILEDVPVGLKNLFKFKPIDPSQDLVVAFSGKWYKNNSTINVPGDAAERLLVYPVATRRYIDNKSSVRLYTADVKAKLSKVNVRITPGPKTTKGNVKVDIYLLPNSRIVTPTKQHLIFSDLEIINGVYDPVISTLSLGPDNTLFVKIKQGEDICVRTTALEFNYKDGTHGYQNAFTTKSNVLTTVVPRRADGSITGTLQINTVSGRDNSRLEVLANADGVSTVIAVLEMEKDNPVTITELTVTKGTSIQLNGEMVVSGFFTAD